MAVPALGCKGMRLLGSCAPASRVSRTLLLTLWCFIFAHPCFPMQAQPLSTHSAAPCAISHHQKLSEQAHLFLQAREERRAAQASAVTGARILLRKEAVWMSRQPKARGTKAAARVAAFADLTTRARNLPQGDTRVTFGGAGMQRQARSRRGFGRVSYV